MRTFIAVEFPQTVKQQIEWMQRELHEWLRQQNASNDLSWTSVQNIHLTLRFLGETDTAQSSEMARYLEDIAGQHESFQITVGGLGCFPRVAQPSVGWLGVGGAVDKLERLQQQIERAAQAVGFAAEKRAYSPHVTLFRTRRNTDRSVQRQLGHHLQRYLERSVQQSSTPTEFTVTKVTHMQSKLGKGGARYTSLQKFQLISG